MVQLDHQTRGPCMFGFGPGLLTSDAMKLGIPVAEQRPEMAERPEIVLRLLDGDVVTANTPAVTLNAARLQFAPYTHPRPHIPVASASTPSGGRLAGEYGHARDDQVWDMSATPVLHAVRAASYDHDRSNIVP